MRRSLIVVAGALVALASAAPAAQAAACPEQPLERTFLPWLDPAWYQPAPDGGFETGDNWTLTGGAAVVEGNQPYLDGAQSLELPEGLRAPRRRRSASRSRIPRSGCSRVIRAPRRPRWS